MTPTEINAIIDFLLRVWSGLNSRQKEKFNAEWKVDEPRLRKALEDGDSGTINAVNDKYRNPLP